jgi:glyoxylase-like metal-dependent hydrolase (beta-lactamase superfamily II)
MRIEEIGRRGRTFTFTGTESALGDYTVYLIEGEKRFYLCDTHLGPRSMEEIIEYIKGRGVAKPLVVFLTHSDWDHIWGVCAFAKPLVVAHELCAHNIAQRGELDLQRYANYRRGDVWLVPPTLTFDSRLTFADDQVEFIHAPGHTADSALCHDRQDGVIYLGDLVERPRPVIGWHDLEKYIDTLEFLGEQPARAFVSSHSGLVTLEDIEKNLTFLRSCQYSLQKEGLQAEDTGLNKLYTLLLFEEAIAETLGQSFDYRAFQLRLWQSLDLDYLDTVPNLLKNVTREELRLALESLLAEC